MAGKKIHVATLLGLGLTVKTLLDNWNSAPADLKVPQLILDTTGIIDQDNATRLGYVVGQKFDYMRPLKTYAPTGIGYAVTKYVGGKDKQGRGLGLNRQLSGIPLFAI